MHNMVMDALEITGTIEPKTCSLKQRSKDSFKNNNPMIHQSHKMANVGLHQFEIGRGKI